MPVRIRGAIRSNITVVEPDGTTTKFNEPGAELSADELDAVFAAVKAAVESADWLVASGSLPPGTPAGVYADLVRSLAGSGTSRGGRHQRPGPRGGPGRRPDARQAESRRARRGDRPAAC